MIKVGVDVERMVFFQDADQIVGDPHGQGAGDAAADADHLNSRDGLQAGKDGVQFIIFKEERVAAGEEHFPDGWCLLQIFQTRLDGLGGDHHVRTADLSFAGTEAAIHGTGIGDEKQGPVRVFVHQIGDRTQVFLAQGINHAHGVMQLDSVRDGLLPDGVSRLFNELAVIPIEPQGISLADLCQSVVMQAEGTLEPNMGGD